MLRLAVLLRDHKIGGCPIPPLGGTSIGDSSGVLPITALVHPISHRFGVGIMGQNPVFPKPPSVGTGRLLAMVSAGYKNWDGIPFFVLRPAQ
jgi:hypothetical protein